MTFLPRREKNSGENKNEEEEQEDPFLSVVPQHVWLWRTYNSSPSLTAEKRRLGIFFLFLFSLFWVSWLGKNLQPELFGGLQNQ